MNYWRSKSIRTLPNFGWVRAFKRHNNRKSLMLPLKLLVSFLLLSWMFSTLEWSELQTTIQHVRIDWMFAALGWVVVSVGVSVVKWSLILKASKLVLPYHVLWKSYWAGIFFNNFLPSSIGGDGLRVYWTGKHTGDLPGATTSIIVERILATMGLCLTALLVAPLKAKLIPELVGFFLLILGLSAFVLVLILSPKLTSRIEQRLMRWPKVQKFIAGLSSHGMRLRNQPKFLAKALLWSIIFQMCVVMVNWCIFQGLAASEVSILTAAYLIPATSVAAMLPVGVNGYGLREGAYMTLFATLNVPGSVAIASSILFALIVSFASLWGGWIWIKEGQLMEWKR